MINIEPWAVAYVEWDDNGSGEYIDIRILMSYMQISWSHDKTS
jgi:hypothetical protein